MAKKSILKFIKDLKSQKIGDLPRLKNDDQGINISPEIKVLLKKTWKKMEFERKVYILSSLVYALVLLGLVGLLLTKKEIVVLTPPKLEEKLAISYNTASEPYYKEMALFLTQLMGNLSPNTVDYSIQIFSSYLDPSIYQEVKDTLLEVANTIKQNQTATTFFPSKIGRIGNTWYVVGKRYNFFPKKDATINSKEVITYEIKFKVRNFRLFVVSFKQLNGDTLRKAELKARKNRTR